MNAIGNIITALDTAHQVWKVRGVQSRPLLSLLLELDDGRHLTDASRKNITADITAFTLVGILYFLFMTLTNFDYRHFNQ